METVDDQLFLGRSFFAMGPSIGASKGILLAWNATLWHKLDIYVGRFTVSAQLKDARSHAEWVATSVYGPSKASDEADFCVELSQVGGMWNHPWLLGGDFSSIRFPNEKRVGCVINPLMWTFSDWILHHDIVDLPLRGADFTWSNMQEDLVMCRLDRFLALMNLLEISQDCVQWALAKPISDRCPFDA